MSGGERKRGRLTRRAFLIGAVAVAGGVAVGVQQVRRPHPNPLAGQDAEPGAVTLNPYLLINQDGVSIITPRAEMGQGVHTTLAALVAEELDLPWESVRTLHGPAAAAYYNAAALEAAVPIPSWDHGWLAEGLRDAAGVASKLLGMQITGGSTSTADAYLKMRKAGAAARVMLVQAAARRWRADTAALRTEAGQVLDPAGGRQLPYTALAADAATIEPPADPPLKPRAQWRLLGRGLPRVDMAAKCTGTAQFGIDVQLPGMRCATVVANPYLGGSRGGFDAGPAEAMRGVERVVDLGATHGDALAVVADNTWRAFQAARALEIDWQPAPGISGDSAAMLDAIAGSIDTLAPDATPRDDGDVDQALRIARAEARPAVKAEYRAPFLAHTTLEPPAAVALREPERLTLWCGHQAPTLLRDLAAEQAGLDPAQVDVRVQFLGGGFGRRAEVDFALQAAAVAEAMPGTPVKLTWTREADIRHDLYRPAAVARCTGVLDRNGLPETALLQIASPSVIRSFSGRVGLPAMGPDKLITEGAAMQPYHIPNYRVVGYAPASPVPLGNWRSVGASFNGFFHECFLDELAAAGGIDPLDMRLRLTRDYPFAQAVLEAVRELSGWDEPVAQDDSRRRGRGLAMTHSFGSTVAQVVEVSDGADGIRVERVHCVADVGLALDPGIIEAQMQSGIVYGLSAAIMEAITFRDGRAEQSNFHDYDALRLAQTPEIRVRILQSGDAPTGVGEPGTPPSKPALANAIYAATGKRLREYPFNKHVRFA
ncbi:xanthine dehydrogenase family protein molybdopterin-binding subunit [uncultured Thiohalocapsa sp.]|uniref:xanthine dehydrogenase family protein molybdopterin-binding subunit n=1 Tax=uncultured Thiohalocapsa sp. TaxID=768990 RepID=UPI0025CFE509|nr:xanthine dehydrogenase family protein molybdopterin-binding subunit [uncultured Thiohalocapsa sp.]